MLNSIKTQACALAEIFQSHGIELSRSQSLEYLAKIYGLPNFNILAKHGEPLTKEIQSLIGKPYRTEDQLRMNGNASEIAVGLSLKGDGDSLDGLAWEIAKAGFEVNRKKPGFLREVEVEHAKHCEGVNYGDECIVRTVSGFSLATESYPEEVTYLRVIDPNGLELNYWNTDEIVEDPGLVLGAIIGALRPSPGLELEGSVRSNVLSVIESVDADAMNQGYAGLDYSLDSVPAGNGDYVGTYLDFSLYLNMDEDGSNAGAEMKVHMFIDCQEKRLCVGDIGYSPSREDGYGSHPMANEIFAAEITKPGVLEATAQSVLKAVEKSESKYTGWVFTVDEFKSVILSRFLGK